MQSDYLCKMATCTSRARIIRLIPSAYCKKMAQFFLSTCHVSHRFSPLYHEVHPCMYLLISFRAFPFTYCPAYRVLSLSLSNSHFVSLYARLRRRAVCFPYFSPSSILRPPFSPVDLAVPRWKTRSWKRLQQKKKIARNLRPPTETYLPSVALFLMNSGMNLPAERIQPVQETFTHCVRTRTIGSTPSASAISNFNFTEITGGNFSARGVWSLVMTWLYIYELDFMKIDWLGVSAAKLLPRFRI